MVEVDPETLSVREAQQTIAARIRPMPAERVSLDRANGRVLAEPVVARFDVPPWDNSAMDGYAVRAKEAGEGKSLSVALDIPAGTPAGRTLPEGAAARIMTGAPIPAGADTVVPVEETSGPGGEGVFAEVGDPVRFASPVEPRANIRPRGEDVRRGEAAVPSGSTCGGAQIAMAATVGRSLVAVHARPRVTILSTGDELVDVDRAGAPDRIVDGNAYGLAALVESAGAVPLIPPIVPDDAKATRRAVDIALGTDAVLTIGGVSVGERDHVRDALEEAGVEIVFWRVAIKPGGPIAFGVAPDGTPIFALPGNPVSALVTFEVFARPALLRMTGRRSCFARPREARLEEAVSKRPGKEWYLRARLREEEGGWSAALTGPQGSGILSSLVAADGLVVLPREGGDRPAGSLVAVLPWGDLDLREEP